MSPDRRSTVDHVHEWDLVLRAYAAALEEHRSVLAGIEAGDAGKIPPPRFVAPPGLSPMPEVFRARAEALVTETAGLIAIATDLAGEDRPLATVHPLRHGVPRRVGHGESVSTMEQRL